MSERKPADVPWPLPGLAIGLVGGAVLGLVEGGVRLWPVRAIMTGRLWLEAASFLLITHMTLWMCLGILVCLFGRLVAATSDWCKNHVRPAALASAAFLVGAPLLVAFGEAAEQEIKVATGLFGMICAIVIGLVLLVPAAWLCTVIGQTSPGRWLSQAMRVAVWPAMALAVAALAVQWLERSSVQLTEMPRSTTSRKAADPGAGRPRDVVLIVFDTLRRDRLGCYGYKRPTSPHIDAFAVGAVRFRNVVSPSPWTGPSHASMFTGLFRSQHGFGYNRVWLEDRFVTLAELLRDHGYQTVALSNNPNVSPITNLTQGFEWFAAPYRCCVTVRNSVHSFLKLTWGRGGPLGPVLGRWFVYDAGGRATAPVARRLLRERNRSRPAFLFVNYMEPHQPYEPRRAYRVSFVKPEDVSRSYGIDQSYEAFFERCLAPKAGHFTQEMALLSDLYDARVREMDDGFAELLQVLAEELDLDNTLVILTADHGENLGDHDLLGHEFCVYDTLVRVPLIVRWPQALRSQDVHSLAQTNDLFPTIPAWIGIRRPPSSEVLVPSLEDALQPAAPETTPRYAVAEYLYPPSWAFRMVKERHPTFDPAPWLVAYRAIADQKWKLITRSDRRTELYDIETDPAELRNVADSERGEVIRLRKKLDDWQRSFRPFDPNQFTGPLRDRIQPDQARRLRDLGYLQ